MEFDSELILVKNETKDTKTFHFSVPEEFSFLPGQFVMLTLGINGEKDARPFSISSSPTRKGYIEITKKIGSSDFSKKLSEIREGDKANVRGPFGLFTLNEKESNIILLAGGIGVTPFRSYIEYATDRKLPNKITLFYSNKTPEDIAFRQELSELQNSNKNIHIVTTVTRAEDSTEPWLGATGRIDDKMIKQNATVEGAIFYVCGPPAMVDAMVEMVKNMNIPKERIHIERFFGY